MYSDSQQALKQLQSNEIKEVIAQIHELCNKLQQKGIQIIFQWIFSQKDINKNILADKYVKKAHQLQKISETAITAESVIMQIKQKIMQQWQQQIKSNQLNLQPGTSWIKHLSLKTNKLIVTIIMQLKLFYEYFKAYLFKFNHADTNQCNCRRYYNVKQTAEHLVVECSNYAAEQQAMKLELNQSVLNFKYLLTTEKGLNVLIKYIQKTLIATRKWQLNLTNSENWQHQERWGEIEKNEKIKEIEDTG